MTGFLLDTNLVSELRRARPERRVVEFIAAKPLAQLFISSVTFAEIRFGIEILPDPLRRAELSNWLEQILRPMFAQRVLPVSEDVMLQWRLLVEAGRKANITFSQPDLLIAATASCAGLVVATRDTSEFERAGVAVVNPWAA